MKQDQWTQQLHDKLAEHEMAAPDDLWADIEAALEQVPVSPLHREKSRFVALRRWTAAAAVALLLGGGYLWFRQSTTALQTNSKETANIEETTNKERAADKPKQETIVEEQPKLLAKLETRKKTKTNTITKAVTETPPIEPIAPPDEMSGEEPQAIPATPAEEKPERHITADDSYRRPQEITIRREKKQHVTLGLYAMNGLGSQSNSNPVQMADALVKRYENLYANSNIQAARISEPVYLTGFEERQHHHRPIAYGLTLGYPLSEKLSLNTGIVYTKLFSEFTQVMRSMQIQREQTLHYVGVPLNLTYRIWASHGFKTYLSAGTAAYWNVRTRLVTEGVNQQLGKDRLQWSLNGSLGLQYDVVPQIGIYVEPGLSYYPDNGSRLQNYFKDKPTTLNLQLGLRVNINR